MQGKPPEISSFAFGTMLSVGGVLIFLLAYLLTLPEMVGSSLEIMLSVTLFVLLSISAVIVHEFGHAVAAAVVGWNVLGIQIGSGMRLFTSQLFGFRWEFRLSPLGGFCSAEPSSDQHYRLRDAIFIIGGPGIELILMAAASLAYLSVFGWQESPYSPLLLLFFAAWSFGLIGSLLPVSFDDEDDRSTHETDMLQLLKLPFVTDQQIARLMRNRRYWSSKRRLENQGELKLDDIYRAAQETPDDDSLLNATADLLMRREDIRFFEVLRLVIQRNAADREMVADLYNRYCSAFIQVGQKAQSEFDQAEKISRQLLEWEPDSWNTLQIRGLVLLTLGKHEQALSLLRQALEDAKDSHSRATLAASLAVAEHRAGNPEAATAHLQQAKAYDPQNAALLWARSLMEAGHKKSSDR